MAYHRVHKLNTKIVRIFNTYGPRMRPMDGRAIPNFITQALKEKPMTIYGSGRQTRSFCYVSDLVEGLYRLVHSNLHDPINLGNPTEITLKELASRIKKITNTKSKFVYRPLGADDPKQRRPDITQAKKKLNWKPKVGLNEGLSATIEWFREHVS